MSKPSDQGQFRLEPARPPRAGIKLASGEAPAVGGPLIHQLVNSDETLFLQVDYRRRGFAFRVIAPSVQEVEQLGESGCQRLIADVPKAIAQKIDQTGEPPDWAVEAELSA